jgi:hypothetical protein
LKEELELENDKLDVFKEFIKKEKLVGNLKIFLDERNEKILELQKINPGNGKWNCKKKHPFRF